MLIKSIDSIPNKSTFKSRSKIARFDPIKDSWTDLGDLSVRRFGHGVIQIDNEFIVVGGSQGEIAKPNLPIESCKFNGPQSVICTKRKLQLSDFEQYPELMLLP